MTKPIAVVAEARNGKLKKASLEAVAAALELAGKSGGQVVALIAGAELGDARQKLQGSGAAKVIAIETPVLAKYSGDGYCRALLEVLRELDPAAILMAHTAMGRDLAPRLAAALETGLLTDVTALHFEGDRFGATRPVYAGKAFLKGFAERAPFMATIRQNSFEPRSGDKPAELATHATELSAADLKSIVTEIVASASERVPLQEARVVVSGGRGMKGPEHFHLIEALAAAFGPGRAAVGASRAVVDAGWRPHREQVGQTGKVVAPTLYIACGISGAIQHLAGMSTSRFIVAINKDPQAPIFKVADYGIVGDVFEVLPPLTEAIKRAVAG
jgi:electron transfer flavoprotein alpha subunit